MNRDLPILDMSLHNNVDYRALEEYDLALYGDPVKAKEKSLHKRQEEFRKLFGVTDDLIDDWACAYERAPFLAQGRLYASDKRVCFNSILLQKNLVLLYEEITSIAPKTTAILFANALQICTSTEKHFFTSLMSRDETLKTLYDAWNSKTGLGNSQPRDDGSHTESGTSPNISPNSSTASFPVTRPALPPVGINAVSVTVTSTGSNTTNELAPSKADNTKLRPGENSNLSWPQLPPPQPPSTAPGGSLIKASSRSNSTDKKYNINKSNLNLPSAGDVISSVPVTVPPVGVTVPHTMSLPEDTKTNENKNNSNGSSTLKKGSNNGVSTNAVVSPALSTQLQKTSSTTTTATTNTTTTITTTTITTTTTTTTTTKNTQVAPIVIVTKPANQQPQQSASANSEISTNAQKIENNSQQISTQVQQQLPNEIKSQTQQQLQQQIQQLLQEFPESEEESEEESGDEENAENSAEDSDSQNYSDKLPPLSLSHPAFTATESYKRTRLTENQLNTTLEDFFLQLWSTEQTLTFLKSLGYYDIELGEWAPSDPPGCLERKAKWVTAVTGNFGIGPSKVNVEQIQRSKFKTKDLLEIEASSVSKNVPFGDNFSVEERWEVRSIPAGNPGGSSAGIAVTVDGTVFWHYTAWGAGMIKGQIDKKSMETSKSNAEAFFKAAEKLLPEFNKQKAARMQQKQLEEEEKKNAKIERLRQRQMLREKKQEKMRAKQEELRQQISEQQEVLPQSAALGVDSGFPTSPGSAKRASRVKTPSSSNITTGVSTAETPYRKLTFGAESGKRGLSTSKKRKQESIPMSQSVPNLTELSENDSAPILPPIAITTSTSTTTSTTTTSTTTSTTSPTTPSAPASFSIFRFLLSPLFWIFQLFSNSATMSPIILFALTFVFSMLFTSFMLVPRITEVTYQVMELQRHVNDVHSQVTEVKSSVSDLMSRIEQFDEVIRTKVKPQIEINYRLTFLESFIDRLSKNLTKNSPPVFFGESPHFRDQYLNWKSDRLVRSELFSWKEKIEGIINTLDPADGNDISSHSTQGVSDNPLENVASQEELSQVINTWKETLQRSLKKADVHYLKAAPPKTPPEKTLSEISQSKNVQNENNNVYGNPHYYHYPYPYPPPYFYGYQDPPIQKEFPNFIPNSAQNSAQNFFSDSISSLIFWMALLVIVGTGYLMVTGRLLIQSPSARAAGL